MTYDRVKLKWGAKEAVTGVEPHPAYITFVFVLITGVISYLSSALSSLNYTQIINLATRYSSGTISPERYLQDITSIGPGPLQYLVILLLGIASSFVAVGYTRYTVKLSRHRKGSVGDLFSMFPKFGQIFGIMFFTWLFTFLWMLLGMIPLIVGFVLLIVGLTADISGLIGAGVILLILGYIFGIVVAIIVELRYSQAYYVAIDHPDWDPLKCITESKRIMRGNKGKLFVLQLSFIGWSILIGITIGIVGIFKNAYIQVTYARFHEYVSGYTPEADAIEAESDALPPPSDDDNSSDNNAW